MDNTAKLSVNNHPEAATADQYPKSVLHFELCFIYENGHIMCEY